MIKKSKYKIGDIVIHLKQHYRAIIIDIDPMFHASGRFNPQALKRSFSIAFPWYRLLVDESNLITYVRETNLSLDKSSKEISHPKLKHYFINYQVVMCIESLFIE